MPIISECTFTDFDLLLEEEVVIDYSNIGTGNECEFMLPVFAYTTDTTDTYRNDFTSSLLSISNRYSTPEFYLEVEGACNVWTEVAQLNDSTYGTYYSTFTTKPNWAGMKIEWHKVYTAEGVGCYRIRQEYTDVSDASVKINYSYKYNLKLWNENIADKTTKLTYTINGGKIGRVDKDKRPVNYKGVVWDKEIRLPNSFFGFESSEYTREVVRYKNGAQTNIQDDQIETIQYNARRLPYSLHREIKITALQCGELYISDYNLGNVATYDHKRVNPSSGYEPTWTTYNSYAPVELTFTPYYENLQRKLC